MAKIPFLKSKEEKSTDDLIGTYNNQWQVASDARRQQDWDWFIRKQMVEGNQFLKWNKRTKQIETPPSAANETRVVINKIYATLRAVRGFVTKYQPKWEVMPEDAQDQTLEAAKKKTDLLDYIYITHNLKLKTKEIVYNGLIYSVGFWEIYWDDDADDGEGDICIDSIDPFDLYFDPAATSIESAAYIIKCVRKTIRELKDSGRYINLDRIKGDNKLAASEMKQRLLLNDQGDERPEVDDLSTVILKEIYTKRKVGKGYEIEVASFIDKTIVRKAEKTGLEEYPFVVYQADVEPLKLYGNGWVKNLIPLQRVINKLEGIILGYNDIFAKGKYIADKDAGVRIVGNRHGQIIEKKRGTEFREIPLQPLPVTPRDQANNFYAQMEDIGGAHDASLGRVPTGAKAGVAIEALQQGDANNLNDLRDNLEDTLVSAAKKIFMLYANYRKTTKKVSAGVEEGVPNFFNVIGEKASNKPGEVDGSKVYTINADADVRVYMGSWLAYSKEAELDKLRELFQFGVIGRADLLKFYNFPDVKGILDRLDVEQQQSDAREAALGAVNTSNMPLRKPPQVNVRVNADAGTPEADAILGNSGLVMPGQLPPPGSVQPNPNPYGMNGRGDIPQNVPAPNVPPQGPMPMGPAGGPEPVPMKGGGIPIGK